jgi:Fe-S-cluster containining protein
VESNEQIRPSESVSDAAGGKSRKPKEPQAGGDEPLLRSIASRLIDACAGLSGVIRDPDCSFSEADYFRIASQAVFICQRCGNCCTSGDPIRLKPSDVDRIAVHFKIPADKAMRKYVKQIGGPRSSLGFRKTCPCGFYDKKEGGCKIYHARPYSCRIFPFLGIYGSESRIIVHKSCPGSLQAASGLHKAVNEAVKDARGGSGKASKEEVDQRRRSARMWFNELLGSLL